MAGAARSMPAKCNWKKIQPILPPSAGPSKRKPSLTWLLSKPPRQLPKFQARLDEFKLGNSKAKAILKVLKAWYGAMGDAAEQTRKLREVEKAKKAAAAAAVNVVGESDADETGSVPAAAAADGDTSSESEESDGDTSSESGESDE